MLTITRLGLVLLIHTSLLLDVSQAIDCFRCYSFNHSNTDCEDPFHNNGSFRFLQTHCQAGRKALNGLFPASHCIKLSGNFEDTGENMVVRGCAVDSGSLTADTELVRVSHCGYFVYNNREVNGCVQSCNLDGCNHAGNRLCTGNGNELQLIALLVVVAFLSSSLS